jgi:hypothetical protein
MPATRTQIRCPKCGTPLQAAVEQVVDVTQDPAGKARLLSGSLNAIRCPACGYEGALATPLVYHDPAKELLLTYFPPEVGLPKNEQERVLGQLINQVVNRLPAERRKAYLLQPQTALTMQGLVERVLQADGITHEQIEEQRAKMRLFEDLLRTPDDQLEQFITAHDDVLDDSFFQLASLVLRNTPDEHAQHALAERIDKALSLCTFGQKLQAQESELRAAAESLRSAGSGLTREKLLEMVVGAPSDERVAALASLARPAMDYTFFQNLTDRIGATASPERERLEALRQHLLEITQQIDQVQQARVVQAAEVLKAVATSKDLDEAIRGALPFVDEVFLGVLEANLRAAREHGDAAAVARFELISEKLRSLVRQSLPPGLQLAQQVLETEDEEKAKELLEASADRIDEEFLRALMTTAQGLEEDKDAEGTKRVRRLHRHALGLSMKAKMAGTSPPAKLT